MAPTLTQDGTFCLSDTGIILNQDYTTGTGFVDIEEVQGFDSAPFRSTKRDHEGVDGGFMDAEFETGRDIILSGTVYSNGVGLEGYLDTLKANWGPSTSLVPLYYYTADKGQRVLFVKPLGCQYNWDSLRRTGCSAITLSAYAEDPRIYDSSVLSQVISFGSVTTSGFAFPFSFPFSFGGSTAAADGGYIINSGNRPAPAVFTIQGPVDTPVIINDTTGDQLLFNIVLGSTDVLTVDLQYHTVKLNGTANRRNTLAVPNWFMLSVGTTYIRFHGNSGTGTLTITYRNAWR